VILTDSNKKEEILWKLKFIPHRHAHIVLWLKKYLDSKNVPYEEFDVSKDRDAAMQMIQKSGQRGVPVLEIDGSIVVGFDKKKIDSLIE